MQEGSGGEFVTETATAWLSLRAAVATNSSAAFTVVLAHFTVISGCHAVQPAAPLL